MVDTLECDSTPNGKTFIDVQASGNNEFDIGDNRHIIKMF
jgi:hypothetical protein